MFTRAARPDIAVCSGAENGSRGVPSEREKMLAGQAYDPLDPELVAAREGARDLCQALNATRASEGEERRRIN